MPSLNFNIKNGISVGIGATILTTVNSNVGIGTTNPSNKLDIVGGVSATGSGLFGGPVTGTTGTFSGLVTGTGGSFSGPVSGTTGTFTGAVSGTTGTFTGAVSGLSFTGSGSGLTSLSGAQITGTIPSSAVSNVNYFIGTTQLSLGRASGSQTLTGVSIDGNAATATTATNLSGGSVNGTTGSFSGAVSGSTFTSSAVTGIAPFTVASTTQVANLNASLLQGYQASTSSTANTIVLRDSSGNVTFALGSASSPSITFSGNTNTGIYSPGTNQVSISTAGSQRLVVDSSGNVGIGKASPAYNLDIQSSGQADISVKAGSTSSAYLRLTTNTRNWTLYSDGSLGGLVVYDVTGASERLRIDSSGNVGIGTASPGYKLTVSDGTRAGFIQPSSGLGSVNFGTATNHSMVLVTNDQARATLDSSGNLGLGVVPSAWGGQFKVYETPSGFYGSNGSNYLQQANNAYFDGGSTWRYKTTGNVVSIYEVGTGGFIWRTAPSGTAGNPITFTQAMTLDASGLLNIGLTSGTAGLNNNKYGDRLRNDSTYYQPSGRSFQLFGLADNATNNWVGFIGGYANSSGSCNILLQPTFNDVNQQAGAYIGGEATGVASTALTFGHMQSGSTVGSNSSKVERMRIDASGNLALGTTTTSGARNTTQVTTDGDGIRLQIAATPVAGQGPRIIFGHNTNNGTQQVFAAIKSQMVSGNDVSWNSSLGFYTGGSSLAQNMTLDQSGNLTVTGAVNAGQFNIQLLTPIVNKSWGTGNPISGTFTLSRKSACMISFNGSSYRATAGIMNLTLSITGIGNIGTTSQFTNEVNSHKAFPTTTIYYVLNAGTYTINITSDSFTDTNDYGNCWIIAFPTP